MHIKYYIKNELLDNFAHAANIKQVLQHKTLHCKPANTLLTGPTARRPARVSLQPFIL